jgi:hypothetical protein
VATGLGGGTLAAKGASAVQVAAITAATAGAAVGGGVVGKDAYDRVTGRDEIERRLEDERGGDRKARESTTRGEPEARREDPPSERARRRADRKEDLARESETSGRGERGSRATGAAADVEDRPEGEVERGGGAGAAPDPAAPNRAPGQDGPDEAVPGSRGRSPPGRNPTAEP